MKKLFAFLLCAAMLLTAVPTVSAYSSTPVSVSAEYTEPLIENVSGYMDWDELGREFFVYDLYNDGLIITCTYDNGEKVILPWYMIDEELYVLDDQSYDNQWGVGFHDVTVVCGEIETVALLEIIESPVDHIEASALRPLIEYVDGRETVYFDDCYDDESEMKTYFRYYTNADDLLLLTVYMSDGSVIEGTASELFDITGASAYVTDNQSYENRWGVGTYIASVEFMGAYAEFEIEIIENDVAAVTVAPERDLIEGVDCVWMPVFDTETFEIIDRYPYYEVEDYITVTITFKDGFVYECPASEIIAASEAPLSLDYMQDEADPWSVGSHKITGRYMGIDFEFEVNIVENPYSGISIAENENKELILTFTAKDGGVVDCKAEKLVRDTTDLRSVWFGDGMQTAVITTDNGSFKVRISSSQNPDDTVKICYGTLESNSLDSCDWIRAADMAFDISSATVLYRIMSTVDAPDTFKGFNVKNTEAPIDYISSICALKYVSEHNNFHEDVDDSILTDIIDISEEDMLLSVIADVDELKAVCVEIFGIAYDFTACSGYDSETGKVIVPLMYLSLAMDESIAELINVGGGGMDKCVFEDGVWTSTVSYVYIDDMGAAQITDMTVVLSDDIKVISVDTGITAVEFKLGDITRDGVINTKDSNLIKRIILGSYSPSEEEIALADINGDGNVNTKDSFLLKKLIINAM